MEGLKVVALISGGKDSFFSILHCHANGHEVVALANLHPPTRPEEEPAEDMDSYMYQTVGHAVIPLYEEALGLPLYRQEISGFALNQDKSYGRPIADSHAHQEETESLVPLLRRVMAAHPQLNAVSTGAILSDYQRTRVESVALRLGLTPLSYLWQWPRLPPCTESSLLEDMAPVGQDSRIIKVASGGLDDSFLWQNVADRRTITRLTKATQRFGSAQDGAVLGEGGEYETLAIDGPAPLWKARIEVDEDKRQVVPGDAGSASLRLFHPRVVPKAADGPGNMLLRQPALLNPTYDSILQCLQPPNGCLPESLPAHGVSAPLPEQTLRFDQSRQVFAARADSTFSSLSGEGQTVADQMRFLMDGLSRAVTPAKLARIAYTTVILRHMADFPAINSVYGSYFTQPNPPARVTIACADVLPHGCDVMLGVTSPSDAGSAALRTRRALHVQSRSYWAPANIGPYSQAVSTPIGDGLEAEAGAVVYVAGQIPLVPATMQLVRSQLGESRADSALQTVLALQHLTRIGEAMDVVRWTAAIAFVVVPPSGNGPVLAQQARIAWEALHEPSPDTDADVDEAEEFDVWNVAHNSPFGLPRSGQDQPHHRYTVGGEGVPPLWIVKVDALPRGASIEWVGYGTTRDVTTATEPEHLYYLLHTFRHRIL